MTEDELRALPKVSLHDHLDGGLRPQTIVDLASEIGLELPTAPDAAVLEDWFVTSCTGGDLVQYLKTFDLTIGVMQTVEGLIRVAKEFVEDLAHDGVVYGEIRWAPSQHLTKGLTLDETVEAIQAGIDAGIDAVAANGRTIRVGQLVTAMRHESPETALQIAQLAVRHRDRGVAGFDIAGPEDGFPAGRLGAAFDYLASEMMPRTVHAGEAAGLDSIRGAIIDGRALRLGHGVRIMEDVAISEHDGHRHASLGRTAEWVREPRDRPRGRALVERPDRRLGPVARSASLRRAVPARIPRDGEPRQPPHEPHLDHA